MRLNTENKGKSITMKASSDQKRISFELFKSNVCHRVKELGDITFISQTIESQEIIHYLERRWYPECLYLLAMVDYLSRENHIPLRDEYNELRKLRLRETLYPAGILVLYAAFKDKSIIEEAFQEAIPEFLRFNIIESDIRNVI